MFDQLVSEYFVTAPNMLIALLFSRIHKMGMGKGKILNGSVSSED